MQKSVLQIGERSFRHTQFSCAFFTSRSEIDSELLDDKTEVLGVLASDKQGLCLLTQGEIDPKLSTLASGLSKIGAKFNEEELPTIVLESNSK